MPSVIQTGPPGIDILAAREEFQDVPISWINRTEDMGVSSSRLSKVGGGYWQVLVRLAIKTRFGLRRLEPGLGRLEPGLVR